MPYSVNQVVNNQTKTIQDMLNAQKAGFWVGMPCIVESYDADKVTITAQPAIRIPIRMQDGTISMEEIPVLQDVPVMFTRGGGCVITHPIKKGDECFVVFADRCIDVWWQNGGIQNPFDNRKHDLSDGFAFFAPQSQPNRVQNISTEALQIRTDDGEAYIELNPETKEINLKATKVNIDADVVMTKTLTVTDVIKSLADVVAKTISLIGHLTTGVKGGSDISGPPQP
ncbi:MULTISPECIES: Gp138 family membrane-puncturing spike protein [unclassified Acinetobacter]|uniref:Gp138 family membrane-puncturing spike protein n=1 Tax=unclassified Acinetobacter TaxID=196816 RepID=UPI0024481259|nr:MULTISPECIES: Gp138 family membrane-puncturing spike protein [unclassified Acinetobacter]MDH0030307.1 Gp138 family membrane-puncturing spike protein [Acinetobacter sp. GD04021]MDH0885875.1 Gp138 family membrane-puncturing spike protein [Acinetobacter sp. GD03873]MDH1082495.1 Gp138 family membrane-puncturing spike protein [Acinetobacter sp. GD03983]MDH2189113.1 Gp138 family membrane-puncturing spike protein [Acinetobacter sp. GD03645]MDH2202301.1 Gp138 family membrane-puncturing spike protei